jgi:hypothetical protein
MAASWRAIRSGEGAGVETLPSVALETRETTIRGANSGSAAKNRGEKMAIEAAHASARTHPV